MVKKSIILILFLWPLISFQIALSQTSKHRIKDRFPVWTFNTKDTRIHGLAIGYFSNSKIKNVLTNGVHFTLFGAGPLIFLIPNSPVALSDSSYYNKVKLASSYKVQGICLSALGSGSGMINGLSLHGFYCQHIIGRGLIIAGGFNFVDRLIGLQVGLASYSFHASGVQIGLFGNEANILKGIQIGGFNEASRGIGIQIGLVNKNYGGKIFQVGLWNINPKRRTPFVNW